MGFSGGSRISHRGVDPSGQGVDLRCRPFLPKMHAKMKGLGPIGVSVCQAYPLDLPMGLILTRILLIWAWAPWACSCVGFISIISGYFSKKNDSFLTPGSHRMNYCFSD